MLEYSNRISAKEYCELRSAVEKFDDGAGMQVWRTY